MIRSASVFDPDDSATIAANRRLAAAVLLAPRIEICEALLAGVPVPARRLVPAWATVLRGDVVLTDKLALRVVASGPEVPPPPIAPTRTPTRGRRARIT